jgi:ribonuclease Z
VVNGTPYLIDLGPGVVRRANTAFQKGAMGLAVANLKTAFITHLHSDHTVGYPDFIFTAWVGGRSGPLEVYGPKGIKSMTDHILAAWQEDIQIRTTGLERNLPGHNDTGYRVNVHEIEAGVVHKDRNITVKAFRVAHGEWPQAFGYRFETPDRSIVISGDTRPSPALVDACNGCDVLIHEVYTQVDCCRTRRICYER